MRSLQESLLDIDSVEASASAAVLFDVLTRKNENGRDVKITADQIRKIVIGGADLTKDNTFKRNFGDASEYVMNFIKDNINVIIVNGKYFDEVRRRGPKIFRTDTVIKPEKRCRYWDYLSMGLSMMSAMGSDIIREFETFISRTLSSTKRNNIKMSQRSFKPDTTKLCVCAILRHNKNTQSSNDCLIAYTTKDCANQEIAEVILNKINNL